MITILPPLSPVGERGLPIGKGGKSIAKRGLKSRTGEEAGKPGTAAVMNSGL